jgi:hypothetical protein
VMCCARIDVPGRSRPPSRLQAALAAGRAIIARSRKVVGQRSKREPIFSVVGEPDTGCGALTIYLVDPPFSGGYFLPRTAPRRTP